MLVSMSNQTSDIVFEPWIGERYAAGIRGKRVLILGESHYHSCEHDEDCQDVVTQEGHHRDLTCSVVSYWKDNPHSSPVSSRTSALFDMGKAEFWASVAFYNYLQSFAGEKARIRPKAEQWDELASQHAFQEVLDKLRPDRILVLGKSTWACLPSSTDVLAAAPVPENALPVADMLGATHEVDRTAYWYTWRPNGKALAFPVRHPSEFGFPPQEWKAAIHSWMTFSDAAKI